MKEDQRRAELKARAAALQEQAKLEQAKLALRLKEEKLRIRTNVSDARVRVIEEMEMNERGSDSTSCSPASPDSPDAQPYVPAPDLGSITKELRKPQIELQKFGGDPMEYPRFLRQFKTRIVAYTDSDDERLSYLEQYTTADAHKIVKGYSHLESTVGYKAAMDKLKNRYGDPEVIAAAYIKRALDWPVIKPDNAKALDDFAVFLMECQHAVGSVQAGQVLEYADHIRQLVKKLPFYLHDRWRTIVQRTRDSERLVRFKHLVDFVRGEAKKATDPLYGRDVLSADNGKIAGGKQFYSKAKGGMRSLASSTENGGSDRPTQGSTETNWGRAKKFAFEAPCVFCKNANHAMNQCENVIAKPANERSEFVKANRLCFGCLKLGHRKRECRGREACKSNVSFCTDKLAKQWGVTGQKRTIILDTMGTPHSMTTHRISGLEISDLDGRDHVRLPPLYTKKRIPATQRHISTQHDIERWDHLQGITLPTLDADIGLLIGNNVPDAYTPQLIRTGPRGSP
ncbi:PREDICTED: uncharacterized protein LOC106815516 [Priapulus caudatus]|uniref:Uncharacterized protein LOC106815516 n=1 Tax=Priapulus caudatus TaxID=37621 RepID=A0ABM1ETE6_PRICU|nr:PREDICTED: uncharacterized protein LOC106815516 [Priapulus caudatus]